MKVSKTRKLIVFSVIFAIVVLALAVLVIFNIFPLGGKKMKNEIIEIAEQKGYDIQFENAQEFCIIKDGVKYYYKNNLGKVRLIKIYTEVPSKAEYEVVDDKGEITITVVGTDKVKVELKDGVIEVNNQGKELVFDEHISFVCSSKFTAESLDSDDIATIRGNADKYYNKITTNFITSEELRELYESGVVMAEEFMKA